MSNITKVGIGVLVVRMPELILLGKRKGSHGAGQWGLPGGTLEYGESFADTAYREMAEEIGSQVKTTRPIPISTINLTEYMPKHYVDIGMVCIWLSGNPKVMEPDKCEEWRWFNMNALPANTFFTVPRIVDAYLYGDSRSFYDAVDNSLKVV